MRLDALLHPFAADLGASDLGASDLGARDVVAIASDSRAVTPGALFFAIAGAKADGARFAAEAVRRGAIAIVTERPLDQAGAPAIVVTDARAALAHAAARLAPRQPPVIAAITGTSGKTSVAAFLRQIWVSCGRSAASLGTIGVVAPSGAIYGSLTTPDPISLHQTLDRLAGEGVTHLAMEASSHGLAQRRLDGVRLTAGAFTNLSRDHLDYHADLEEYLAAKLRLFDTLLGSGRPVVVDADSDVAPRVLACARQRGLQALTVGAQGDFIRLLARAPDGLNTHLTLEHAGERYSVRLPLAGAFQTANALVAAGLALAGGETAATAMAALEQLEGAPGRLEYVGARQGGAAFVDYAHKPAALENALDALRPFVRGKLILVFGCGGDRDRGKRALMGAIAARRADLVIVTDDNPRSEMAHAIRSEIIAGAQGGGAVLREIGDRAAAIEAGVAALGDGDLLLIAGKGHETGQIIGETVLPFCDRDVLRTALEGRNR